MHLAQSSEILLLSNEFDCFLSTALNFYSLYYEPSSHGAVDAVKLHYSPLNNSNKIPPSRIVGRCNGLLLCLTQIIRNASEVQDRNLILWNPSINDSKVIRPPNSGLIEFHLLGFGYDSSTDDYKIVRIINGTGTNQYFKVFNDEKECRVDIYSLKTDSWKTVEHDAPHLFIGRHRDREGCAVHGSIYWLQCSPYLGILGFDLKDNKFRELQSMPNDLAPRHNVSLKALGESLAIYQYDIGNKKLVAWTTKAGKKEEWIKLMTLYIYPDPHKLTARTRPVSLMKNGKVLVHLLQVLGGCLVSPNFAAMPYCTWKHKLDRLHQISIDYANKDA
ncbi:hypothetical protein LguiA_031150 [Lonicera macranthoides]